jgi:hypothetical protein
VGSSSNSKTTFRLAGEAEDGRSRCGGAGGSGVGSTAGVESTFSFLPFRDYRRLDGQRESVGPAFITAVV